jgi:hypothetical protein
MLLWSLFYNLEKFALGPHSFVVIGDEADSRLAYMVAWWRWFFEPFQHFWTPDALAGFDSYAAAADPGLEALFFAIMPGWMAYATFRLVCVYLQGYFVFRLLHDALGVRGGIALGAGFVYVAINHHYFPDEQLFALLPLVLWSMHRDWGSPYRHAAMMAALGILYTYGSVYAFTFFTLPCIWVWLFVFHGRDRTRWGGILAFTATYLLLNLPRLVAAAMLGGGSARMYQRSWFEPLQQSLMLDQGYWVVILLMAAIVMAAVLRDVRLARITAVTVSIAAAGPFLVGVAGLLTILLGGRLWEQIGMRFYDASPLLNVAVLGVVADIVTAKLRDNRMFRLASVGVPAVLVAGAMAVAIQTKRANIWDVLHSSTYAFAFEHPELKDLAARTLPAKEPFRVAGFNAFRTTWRLEESFLLAYGFETAGGFVNVWPRHYRDYWLRLLAPLRAQDPMVEVKMNNKTYLFADETGFVWRMCGVPLPQCVLRPADFYNMNLLAFLNVRYIITPIPFEHPALALQPSRVRDFLLAVEPEKVRQKWLLTLKGEPALHMPLYVYENRDALPRFFVATRTRVFPDSNGALDAMAAATLEELRTTAFLDEQSAQRVAIPVSDTAGQAVRVSDGTDTVRLRVSAPGGGVLVTSISHSPFWKACVAGRSSPPLRINHAFLGVPLEAGNYEVVLNYEPPWRPTSGACDKS